MAGKARRYRLSGTGVYDRIFREGTRREGEFLQLVFAEAAGLPGRAGLVVGRHAVPLAVDRNRVRRMLRVALQEARPAIESHDVILRLKKRASREQFAVLATEARRLLATVGSEHRAS